MKFFSSKNNKSNYIYRAAELSRQGKRPTQQDFCGMMPADDGVYRDGLFFAAVADGMGGLSNGNEVSQFTVDQILKGFNEFKGNNSNKELSGKLEELVISINEQVFSKYAGESGTTLAAIIILEEKLFWITVGDSMILLCRDGRIFRLNHEHSYHMLVRRNAILDGEPDRLTPISRSDEHMLSAYIGAKELFDIDRNLYPYTLIDGDKIIICTDGVSRSIDDSTMSVIMKNPPDRVVEIIGGLIEHKANPKQDNYTAVITEVMIENQV